MPAFILDHGSPEAAHAFGQLSAFAQGYIEAMFFTSTGYLEDEDLEHATVAELAPETLAAIVADCDAFWLANETDLDEAIDTGRIDGYDETRAGHDYWYTRNGHGTGFWDRDLGTIGETLTAIANRCTSVDLYRGDDGRLYLS